MFCQECGTQCGPDDKFCPNCGTPIPDEKGQEEAAALASLDTTAEEGDTTAATPAEPAGVTPTPEVEKTTVAPVAAVTPTVPTQDAAAGAARNPAASGATTVSKPLPVVEQGTDPRSEPLPAPSSRKSKPRTNKALVGGLCAVLAVLIGGGIWFYTADPADLFGRGPQAQAAAAAEEAAEQERQAKEEEERIRADERAKAEQEQKDKEAAEAKEEAAAAKAAQEAAEKAKDEEEAKRKQAENALAARNGSSGSNGSNGSSTQANHYILPDSATRVYSDSELSALSNYELFLARNEIFARHGRKFKEPELDEYFRGQAWYHPTYDGEVFDAMPEQLNSTEQANCQAMIAIEKGRDSIYTKAPYV